LLLLGVPACAAASLGYLAKSVSEFTLPNGLHIIVLERHSAPVVSLHLIARGGWADDPPGQRGMSRLMERSIREGSFAGGANAQAERQAHAALEAALDSYAAESSKEGGGDLFRVQRLRTEVNMAAERAEKLSRPDSLAAALTAFGGAQFNTMVLADSFSVITTLPSAEISLWFSEISAYLRDPSFRRFYRYRRELELSSASTAQASPAANLLAAAFGRGVYGLPDAMPAEVAGLRVADARKWHSRILSAANLTLVAVGDADPALFRKLAEQHLGGVAAGTRLEQKPDSVTGESGRPVAAAAAGSAEIAIGFRRPDVRHADDPVLDVVQQLLASGPFARGVMLGTQQIAAQQGVVIRATVPGGERPCLFGLMVRVNPGRKLGDALGAVNDALAVFRATPVNTDALDRAKNSLYWTALAQLDNNSSAAALIALNHIAYGKWSKLDDVLTGIRELTPARVQAVAAKYLVPENQVVWRSDGIREDPKAESGEAKP
jgi:predicted Zn-dependent peptidase